MKEYMQKKTLRLRSQIRGRQYYWKILKKYFPTYIELSLPCSNIQPHTDVLPVDKELKYDRSHFKNILELLENIKETFHRFARTGLKTSTIYYCVICRERVKEITSV